MLFCVIRMSDFIGAEIHQREVMGEIQDCISIPIKINGIRQYPKAGLQLHLLMVPKKPNPRQETHYLSVSFDSLSSEAKKMQRKVYGLGYWKQLKYIGKVILSGTKLVFEPRGKRQTSLDDALDKEE